MYKKSVSFPHIKITTEKVTEKTLLTVATKV